MSDISKVLIRNAIPTDIPVLVDLLAELFSLEPDFPIVKSAQLQGLTLLFQESNAYIFVAEYHGKVVGMVTLQSHISTGFGVRDLLLEDLVVTQALRGQGIGTRLLQAAENAAKEIGCQRLRLSADEHNTPTTVFYAQHGWKPGRMRSWYRILD